MKVRIINDLNANYRVQGGINVIPFGIIGEINLKRQMQGCATDLVTIGKLSKKLGGLTFFGAETDNCGIKRRSVFVYDEGKLVSICDQNRQTDKFSPSFGYKTFTVCGKKIGVLVDKDLFEVDAVKTLIYSDCCAIIDLYADFLTKKNEVASEFYSYVFGVDFVVAATDGTSAFFSSDKSFLQSNACEFELPCEKRYSEIRIKRRGV